MPGGDSCNILRFTISNFFFISVPFEIAPNRTPVMDPSRILSRSNCILVGGIIDSITEYSVLWLFQRER